MTLRIGLDFGTATTCVATVPNFAEFRPEVVPLRGTLLFANSSVWITGTKEEPPVVRSESRNSRAPAAVFERAEASFNTYWAERVRAQKDGVRWHRWKEQGREGSMLLTYFKPELADDPVRKVLEVADRVVETWDGLSQSADVNIYTSTRVISDPDPDTDDLVAATAAVIRAGVEAATKQYRQKVSLLMIGMPSFGAQASPEEVSRAAQRRLDAVKLAAIGEDFGTEDFRTEFQGEAQAAGFGLDLEGDFPEAYAFIVDVGAGTTDLALVPYRRDRGTRLVPQAPIAEQTMRFAGRNLNEAVVRALLRDKNVAEAKDAMDDRSWQLLVEQDGERIKRDLAKHEQAFRIGFHRYAADTRDDGRWYNERRRALNRTVTVEIGLESPSIADEVGHSCQHWSRFVRDFLQRALALCPGPLVGVELVGGAFRFTPLLTTLKSVVEECGITAPLTYRTLGDESQTVVARGLARKAAMEK
jgi:hypothetical protein